LQEAYSSLIIIYKATLVRIANKCFLNDRRVRRENRKYASSFIHDRRENSNGLIIIMLLIKPKFALAANVQVM